MVSTRNSPKKKNVPKLSPAKPGATVPKTKRSTPKKTKTPPAQLKTPPPQRKTPPPAKKKKAAENESATLENVESDGEEGTTDNDGAGLPAPEGDSSAKKTVPPAKRTKRPAKKKTTPAQELEEAFGSGDESEYAMETDATEDNPPVSTVRTTERMFAMMVRLQQKQEQRIQEERLEKKQERSKRLQHDADPLKVLETALKGADDDESADYRTAIRLLAKTMPSADGGLQEDVKAATKPTGAIDRKAWASVVGKALTRWTSARSIEHALSFLADPDMFPKNMREHRSFDAHLGYCIRLGMMLEEAKTVTGADLRAEDMVTMVNKIINKWPAEIVTALNVPSLVDGLDTLTSLSKRLRALRPVVLQNVNAAWAEHAGTNRHGGGSNRRNQGVVGVADDARKGSSRNAYNDRDRNNQRSPSPRRRSSRTTRDRSRSPRKDRTDRARSPRKDRKDRSRSPHKDRRSRSRSPARKTRRGTGSQSKYACRRPECARDKGAPAHDGKNCPLTICFECKQPGHKSTKCPTKRNPSRRIN